MTTRTELPTVKANVNVPDGDLTAESENQIKEEANNSSSSSNVSINLENGSSPEISKEEKPSSLSRGIHSWHVTLISLGGIVGSCYFLGVGLTFSEIGAVPVLISYLIAGVCVFGVMQSFSELLVNLPRNGSFVSYNREFLGDIWATAIGWSFWLNWVVFVPSECLAFATFMNTYYTIPFKKPE